MVWESFRADISGWDVVVFAVAEVVLPLHEAVDGVVVRVVPVRVLQVSGHALPERALLELNWNSKFVFQVSKLSYQKIIINF